MSALPNRIRQQAELANQLAAKAKSGTLTMEDVRSPTLTPAASAPMGEQPMPKGFQPQPAGPGVPGLGTPGFQPQAPTAPNAQAPAAPNAPAPADDQAEHRYKVLQGKYNAEVPRLQAQNKELSERFSAMQNQLSATQALLAGMGQQPQAPHLAQRAPQPSLVTAKERTEFGEDLYDFVKRAAQEVVAPQVHSLEERFRPTAQAVQQMAPVLQQTQENQQRTSADVAHERMCDGLDDACAGWEKVNKSPEFQAWLDEVDPYAGAKRGAMLAQAYGSGDVTRVAAFFTGFTKEHAAVAPGQQQNAPAGQGTPPAPTPNVTLASLAAPGTGIGGPQAAGTPNESGQQRVYTQAEISAFYTDVRKGAYRNRVADKDAIERDIFLAQKQGRVRP